ncbi:uncharacterized protein LOC130694877 isoform X2 [Daphnia carinata]|uniref:uncharacterized protein LOC130694877 isoform X2 n=1 Tax=Daphnia carinata TaxID=120202 RepID=UPI00257F90BE|nr:uncharacterized protein LOC130694877 isoform X2 [Daphnia carinata]
MSTDGSSKSQPATSSHFPKSMRSVESMQSGSSGSESNIQKHIFQNSGKIGASLTNHADHKPMYEVVMASQSNRLEGTTQLRAPGQHPEKPYGQRAKKSFPKPKFKAPMLQMLGKDPTNPEIEVVEYVVKGTCNQESKQDFTVPILKMEKNVGAMKEFNDEVLSQSLKKEECEEPKLSKPSPLPNRTEASYSQNSGQATIKNASPVMKSHPVADRPLSMEMINGEEMAVTSTTTSHIASSSPIDEEHKKSILASMKQAYTSELSQSDKALKSENEVNLDEPVGMPALTAIIPESKINNEGTSDIDTPKMPVLEMHAEDSFDEELNSLVKKSRFSSPDSKTDFGMDSQEDVFSEACSKPTGLTAVAAIPVDLSHQYAKPVHSNSKKQFSDLQDIHHPPTPAPTPQTDDLEAAMAALHGEPLDLDPIETVVAMTKIPVTNLVVTKVKRDKDLVDISAHSADSDYHPDSGNTEISSDDVVKSKRSPKPHKYHKMGPKSMVGTKLVNKPTKPSPMAKVTDEAHHETKAETKPAVETKQPTRLSREVEKLCADEMVNNILRSMEVQGSSRRRASQAVVTYKECQSNNPEKDIRFARRAKRIKEEGIFEKESTPPKKNRNKRTTSIASSVESVPQDRALQQWEALQNSNNEDRVVYVPRKLVNPADASKIVRRRTFSSGSSTDANQNGNRKVLHSQDDVQTATYALKKDHSYTTIKNEASEPVSSQRGTDLASKLSASCQEIHIRCKEHLLYVTLCPRTSKLRNSLNSTILKELSMLLRKLKMEPQIHVVLFTSAGPDFCTGIDFPSLIHDNMASRLESSISMVNHIQEFITELANCDKILVGGVVGSAIGLGVTMLPYLDLVYACDKTTFYLPYVKLGQSSEGGLPLTFPSTSRNLLSLLVHEGRRLTATQAKTLGLVDDVFLPDSFQEEMIPRVVNLALLYSQNSLPIKRMSRAALRRDLPAVLKEESQLLRQSWISEDFQRRAKQLFDSGDLLSA